MLRALFIALVAAGSGASSPARSPREQPVAARNGMVVAQETRATRIGVEILQHGGNAVDAAVAIGFALAVTYPRAGNIGGGGFMLVHLAARKRRADRDRLSRDRAGRDHARHLPRRQGRGRSEEVARFGARRSACPARSPGWRWRMRNTARANSRSAQLIAPAIALARDGIRGRGRRRGFAAARAAAAGALAGLGEDLPQARRHARSAPATRWCSAISPTRCRRSPTTARARSTRARSPRRSSPPCSAAGGMMTRDDLKNYQRDRARAGARHLSRLSRSSRCRRPRPAACILLEILNILEGYPDLARSDDAARAASDDRGDEARLCRPRRISRRSRHA